VRYNFCVTKNVTKIRSQKVEKKVPNGKKETVRNSKNPPGQTGQTGRIKECRLLKCRNKSRSIAWRNPGWLRYQIPVSGSKGQTQLEPLHQRNLRATFCWVQKRRKCVRYRSWKTLRIHFKTFKKQCLSAGSETEHLRPGGGEHKRN
jgi:hypothetical protein